MHNNATCLTPKLGYNQDMNINPTKKRTYVVKTQLSTGKAAILCQVSPRTVAKWCESGRTEALEAPVIAGPTDLD